MIEGKPLTEARVDAVTEWVAEAAQRTARYDIYDDLLDLVNDWRRLRRAVDLAALEDRVTALERWVDRREDYEAEQRER